MVLERLQISRNKLSYCDTENFVCVLDISRQVYKYFPEILQDEMLAKLLRCHLFQLLTVFLHYVSLVHDSIIHSFIDHKCSSAQDKIKFLLFLKCTFSYSAQNSFSPSRRPRITTRQTKSKRLPIDSWTRPTAKQPIN